MNPYRKSSLAFLEAHVQHEMTEPDFVAVAQDARLVGDELLPVEERPVIAVLIDQAERASIAADNGRMAAGNALFDGFAVFEIDHRRFTRVGVNAPHRQLGDLGGVESEGLVEPAHFEDQVHFGIEACCAPAWRPNLVVGIGQGACGIRCHVVKRQTAAGTGFRAFRYLFITAIQTFSHEAASVRLG